MNLECVTCQGTGIGPGMRSGFGELMNLCPRCDGVGEISDEPGERPFVAIFPVSDRYAVNMKIPRQKGGVVLMDIEWWPRVPPDLGRGSLTHAERKAYERGRGAALAIFSEQMGITDYSVVGAKERH